MNILFIFLIILGLLLTSVTSSMLTLCLKWKYYKRIYQTLGSMKFYLGRFDMIHNHKFPIDSRKTSFFKYFYENIKEDEFIWFKYNNSFMLKKKVSLNNNFITWCDPYSLYWLLKYKKFFKNIDVNKLESAYN